MKTRLFILSFLFAMPLVLFGQNREVREALNRGPRNYVFTVQYTPQNAITLRAFERWERQNRGRYIVIGHVQEDRFMRGSIHPMVLRFDFIRSQDEQRFLAFLEEQQRLRELAAAQQRQQAQQRQTNQILGGLLGALVFVEGTRWVGRQIGSAFSAPVSSAGSSSVARCVQCEVISRSQGAFNANQRFITLRSNSWYEYIISPSTNDYILYYNHSQNQRNQLSIQRFRTHEEMMNFILEGCRRHHCP